MPQQSANAGVLAGLIAIAFAVLGIFTIGFVFVPLAAICAAVALLRGISGVSGAGIAVSLLGWILTVVGVITSPVLLLALGIGAAGPALAPQAAIAARPAPDSQQVALPCPVSGGEAVLRGTALVVLSSGAKLWILKTEKPGCLTLTRHRLHRASASSLPWFR